jgi:hypothetical protein
VAGSRRGRKEGRAAQGVKRRPNTRKNCRRVKLEPLQKLLSFCHQIKTNTSPLFSNAAYKFCASLHFNASSTLGVVAAALVPAQSIAFKGPHFLRTCHENIEDVFGRLVLQRAELLW